jgi:hypothetical protein
MGSGPDGEGAMLNLTLALIWAVMGVGLIVYQATTGDPRWQLEMGGVSVSYGWFALLLCLYNLARWWSGRNAEAERLAVLLAQAAHRRRHRRPAEPGGGEPDPNFNFTDEPPPQEQPGPGDRPPSPN